MDFNIDEINARLEMLAAQRNHAMDSVVLLSGEIAKLRKEIAALKTPQSPPQSGGEVVALPIRKAEDS